MNNSNHHNSKKEDGGPGPNPILIEEGVMTLTDDLKSVGSAATAPSVSIADGDSTDNHDSNASSTCSGGRRRLFLAATVAVLVVGAVILGAVLGTRNNNSSTATSTSSVSSASSVVTDYDDNSNSNSNSNGSDETPTVLDTNTNTNTNTNSHVNIGKPFEDVDESAVPLLNADALQSYANREDLEADLTLMAKIMVNGIVTQNIALANSDTETQYQDTAEAAAAAGMAAAVAAASTSTTTKSTTATTTKTNNQEKDADEADFMKNDDTYVYAVYGNYLIVWDRQGNMVAQEEMPDPNMQDQQDRDDDDAAMYHGPGYSSIYIEGIQLTDNHVIVIIGGLAGWDENQIAYGQQATQVRVYLKPNTTTTTTTGLTLVATQNIDGYYQGSRYLDATDSIHIVTAGDVNTYQYLNEPLDLAHFRWMSQADYIQAAKQRAQDTLIPQFVQKLTNFLMTASPSTNTDSNIMKVNSWVTTETQRMEQQEIRQDSYQNFDEAFRAYIFVTSIPANDLPTTAAAAADMTPAQLTTASVSAMLTPSSTTKTYMTLDSIVLTMEKYDWKEDTQQNTDSVILIHLKVVPASSLSDASVSTTVSTTFYSVSPSISGTVRDARSLDVQGTDLRVATTLQKWFPMDSVYPVCGDAYWFEDSCINEDNWNDCFDAAMECRTNVIKTGCPYTFTCGTTTTTTTTTETAEEQRSSTDNYVVVFDISQPGQMTELGRVRIGDAHEVVTSVHFDQTFSYATTFDQRDPFYVLQLDAGKPPKIASTLKLDGISNYLHPLNEDDATLLVGIGQEVSGTGLEQTTTGLTVSVFDVSDPHQPIVLASRKVIQDNNTQASSVAEWDPKAVQYNNGLLSIPLSSYSVTVYDEVVNYGFVEEMDVDWTSVAPQPTSESTAVPSFAQTPYDENSFEGFIVLNVGNAREQGGLEEVFRVSSQLQSNNNNDCYSCNGYFPGDRSFFFDDGSLMTMHQSSVASTDVKTGMQKWGFVVTIEGQELDCCW